MNSKEDTAYCTDIARTAKTSADEMAAKLRAAAVKLKKELKNHQQLV